MSNAYLPEDRAALVREIKRGRIMVLLDNHHSYDVDRYREVIVAARDAVAELRAENAALREAADGASRWVHVHCEEVERLLDGSTYAHMLGMDDRLRAALTGPSREAP